MVQRKRHHRLMVLCLAMVPSGHSFHGNSWRISERRHHNGVEGASARIMSSATHPLCLVKSSSITADDSSVATNSRASKSSMQNIGKEIVFLGRRGRTAEALALYFDVERPNVRLMNGAIDACARARKTNLNKAFEILDEGVTSKNLSPNVFTFGALMSACARASNGDRALELLRSMEEDYNVAPNAVVYSSAISACARSKPPKAQTALKLLREAVEEKELSMSVVGFNAAVSACAKAGDWESAISILTRLEEANFKNTTELECRMPQPDAVTYGTVFAACERGQQWSLVLKYAKSMRDRNLQLDGVAVTSCLHACQQLGLAEEALQYLELMDNIKPPPARKTAGWKRSGAKRALCRPDEVAYRLAISACARGGAWEEGLRLLEKFQDATGTPPDVVAYTSAITGCEYAGEWKRAFIVLDKMRKNGVEPNEVTMAAVIGACATACSKLDIPDSMDKDKKYMPEPQKRALQLLSLMKKDETVVNPNVPVYNAAIRACAESHDLKRALHLLEEIREAEMQPTIVTYGSLMTACERVGCVESASKVFRSMKVDLISPNEIIYGAAISCCRKAGESERALLLLRKMIKEELKPNVATFNTVIVAQAEGRDKRDMERAILVYKLMKSKYASEQSRPNRQTYTLLIRFFSSKKQPITAEAFLRKMREDSFVPDVDLFTSTVTAYERAGQPMQALRIMESMQEDGYDFYSVKVLNSAFKKAVKLANVVGRGLASSSDDEETPDFLQFEDDEDHEGFTL